MKSLFSIMGCIVSVCVRILAQELRAGWPSAVCTNTAATLTLDEIIFSMKRVLKFGNAILSEKEVWL